MTKDGGEAPEGASAVADDDEEAEEEPPSPGRLAAALAILRRLRTVLGSSVFGADADLVEHLLRRAP